MSIFSNKKPLVSRLLHKKKQFLLKSPFFQKHALNFLNISQFLGVVNDNIFKFLTLFLLIDLRGVEHSSEILFWVGTIYVLPFLLFSSAAGIIADRFSKQKIIVILKALEVVITILGVIAFSFSSAWACYTLLFLLSFQSAIFGPPKYSIIPEIVHFEKISKANGIITSFTYLAMILGTFLASFTTQITGKNFTLSATLCLFIAILGFLSSLFIPYTTPSRTTKRINIFFIKEIYLTLKFCYQKPHLFSTVMGAAFFLYVGAFFQLNIIPYTIQTLGLSEVGGGYLFLTVAIGIALGSVIAGKLSKNRVELGLTCLAGIGLSFFLYFLALIPPKLFLTLIILIFNGLCGGIFIVPLDAYIQTYSPTKQRGQIVAASNFLSFCGVLLAPFSIYLFSGILKLKASTGFFIMALQVTVIAFLFLFHFSGIFLCFFSKRFFLKFYKVRMKKNPLEWERPPLLIMKKSSLTKAMLLSSESTDVHFFIFRSQRRILDILYRLFSNVDVFYISKETKTPTEFINSKLKPEKIACVLLSKGLSIEKAALTPEALDEKEVLYIDVKRSKSSDLQGKKDVVFQFSETP